MSGISLHDLYNGTAFMGLHGIAQAVDRIECRIGSRVKANGVICTDNIIIDHGQDTNKGDPILRQYFRTRNMPSPPMVTIPSNPNSLQVAAARS